MRLAAALLSVAVVCGVSHAATDADVERLVERHVRDALPENGAGGCAVAVRLDGRTQFFNHGRADLATDRAITPDTLFNLGSLAKALDATLLADAVRRGELSLDDPVTKYIPELADGGDIRRVTLGHLGSFSSGLVMRQDRPPWTATPHASPAAFLAAIKQWTLEEGREPGRQVNHVHSGFVLLRLVLERRFDMPIAELLERRVFAPLGLTSTVLPVAATDRRTHPRGRLPPDLLPRAVQGYGEHGEPIGGPGDLQGYYYWHGAGQMYSSARDMAAFLAANLGELPDGHPLREAVTLAQRGVVPFGEQSISALAWERHRLDTGEIVDRYGGTNNASAIIAMMPERKLGVAILCNRSQDVATASHDILNGLTGAERETTGRN